MQGNALDAKVRVERDLVLTVRRRAGTDAPPPPLPVIENPGFVRRSY